MKLHENSGKIDCNDTFDQIDIFIIFLNLSGISHLIRDYIQMKEKTSFPNSFSDFGRGVERSCVPPHPPDATGFCLACLQIKYLIKGSADKHFLIQFICITSFTKKHFVNCIAIKRAAPSWGNAKEYFRCFESACPLKSRTIFDFSIISRDILPKLGKFRRCSKG